MQLSPLTIITTIIISLFSCTNQSEYSSSPGQDQQRKPFEGDASENCFDVQMEVWMDKFQHYQQTGSDMFAADQKARDASFKAYHDCQHRKSRAMVNNEARKD